MQRHAPRMLAGDSSRPTARPAAAAPRSWEAANAAAIVHPPRREPLADVDVAMLLDAVLAMVEGRTPEGACVAAHYVAGPLVQGRTRDLARVLVALLQNALEATDPARPNEVRVRTSTRAQRVEIFVEDTGRGMDAETLARSRAAHGERSGGLALARRLVADMGGSLELDSVLGLGTRARVILRAASEAR